MKQLPYINKSEAIIGYSESVIAKNENNDCFVRAVASSFECPYDTAHAWVKEKFNRVNRRGTKRCSSKMEDMSINKEMFNGKTVISISDLRVWDSVKLKAKRTTLNQFIKKYPTGTFILLVRGHAFTLKNGSVVGNVKDSKSLKKIINSAFKIV